MKKTTKKTAVPEKTVKKETKQKDAGYTVTLKVFGKLHTSSGETLQDAFESFGYRGKIVGNPLLIVTHNDAKKERVISNVTANRLFSTSRIIKEIAIKNMCTIFNIL
jgi:hypothetical protein